MQKNIVGKEEQIKEMESTIRNVVDVAKQNKNENDMQLQDFQDYVNAEFGNFSNILTFESNIHQLKEEQKKIKDQLVQLHSLKQMNSILPKSN